MIIDLKNGDRLNIALRNITYYEISIRIEYDFGSQQVKFLIWSQYFDKIQDGAIPMFHELVFADLKPAKPIVSEDGTRLRKLMVEVNEENT
mgnify:CR=1 FL=1